MQIQLLADALARCRILRAQSSRADVQLQSLAVRDALQQCDDNCTGCSAAVFALPAMEQHRLAPLQRREREPQATFDALGPCATVQRSAEVQVQPTPVARGCPVIVYVGAIHDSCAVLLCPIKCVVSLTDVHVASA